MRLKLAVAVLALAGAGGCYVVATPRGVNVGVSLRPFYVPIAGTGIRIVTNADGDVFYYGGYYYRWRAGRWYRSRSWTSGWQLTAAVPRAFLSIPQNHPKHYIVKNHPLHPSHPTRPPQAVGPARPAAPAVRARVRNEVRNEVREEVKEETKSRPAAPASRSKPKKEKDSKGNKKGKK